MTFSIVARSDDGESWGVAVASKFLAVGSAVPAAVAGVGAIATQADANLAYKGQALAHLDEGATADAALQRLLEEDEGRDHRQVGIVDLDGNAASHTGSACLDWAGGRGSVVRDPGNVLAGEEVVAAMEQSWTTEAADQPFARRLLAALVRRRHGGDRRGRQSAALFVVRRRGRVRRPRRCRRRPAGRRPPGSRRRALARLLDLNDLYLTASTEGEKVAVTPELEGELEERAHALGHRSFHDWLAPRTTRCGSPPTARGWTRKCWPSCARPRAEGGRWVDARGPGDASFGPKRQSGNAECRRSGPNRAQATRRPPSRPPTAGPTPRQPTDTSRSQLASTFTACRARSRETCASATAAMMSAAARRPPALRRAPPDRSRGQ
ncbi:MAG: DUF1028 domain-containing protein [Nocardioides sp.]